MSRCEAMTSMWTARGDQYVMCGREPAHLHHKLTRARGGKILDKVGETYHQMFLCPEHHDYAHDSDKAYQSGLLIDGYVTKRLDGRPRYQGSDQYLSEHYGERA